MIGTFTSNVDMKSGAPAFGTPEYMRATQMTGQMARFYGLPLRSSGVCAANIPDGQAMWETSQQPLGRRPVGHEHGLSRGGLAGGRADREPREVHHGLRSAADDPALYGTRHLGHRRPRTSLFEAIADVGPDGHYFGVQHTQDRYTTAFYAPIVSDWRNYEAWELDGAVETPERAHRIFKAIMDEFDPPPMDAAVRDELQGLRGAAEGRRRRTDGFLRRAIRPVGVRAAGVAASALQYSLRRAR